MLEGLGMGTRDTPDAVLDGGVVGRRAGRARAAVTPGARVERGVLQLLESSAVPRGADDLMAGLRDQGISVSAVSVYRALERLQQHGEIQRVEMLSAFRIRDSADAMLLVCSRCGRTASLAVPQQRGLISKAIAAHGFTEAALAIEARSRCADCAATAES